MTRRVALIEDDATVNRALRRSLTRRDYDVVCLAVDDPHLDRLMAEQSGSAYPFDVVPLFWDGQARVPPFVEVVVSDYYLDGHTLYDVLATLRASAGVVAITGASSTDLVRQLVAAGIDGYVRKPYDGGEELVAAVELAARAHQTRERGRALIERIKTAAPSDRTWRQEDLQAALLDLQRFAQEVWK